MNFNENFGIRTKIDFSPLGKFIEEHKLAVRIIQALRALINHSCYSGHMKVIEILIGNGADTNVQTKKGETALYQAILQGKSLPICFQI